VAGRGKSAPRVEFSILLENGFLRAGQKLYFAKDKTRFATIKPDARLRAADGFVGSIHKAGSHYMNNAPCNGWDHWYLREDGRLVSLGDIREKFRVEMGLYDGGMG
jgi:modification methylase